MFEGLKQELYDFYLHGDAERSKEFADKCFAIMDERFENGMTVTAQKLLQYDTKRISRKVFGRGGHLV